MSYNEILWDLHVYLMESEGWWGRRTRATQKKQAVQGSIGRQVELQAEEEELRQDLLHAKAGSSVAVVGKRSGEMTIKLEPGAPKVTVHLLLTHKRASKISPVTALDKAAKKLKNTSCGNFKVLVIIIIIIIIIVAACW